MDRQLEEIEKYFSKASDLLRVTTFVKYLKKEKMNPDVLQQIATTYEAMKRLKGIAKDIDRLHNMQELNAEDQHQLYLFEEIKSDMLNEIRDATKSLESKTNLKASKSVELCVAEDLDRATSLFKEVFLLGPGIYELRTLESKK